MKPMDAIARLDKLHSVYHTCATREMQLMDSRAATSEQELEAVCLLATYVWRDMWDFTAKLSAHYRSKVRSAFRVDNKPVLDRALLAAYGRKPRHRVTRHKSKYKSIGR